MDRAFEKWSSQGLWSLWDIMKPFFVGSCVRAFAQMMQLSERAGNLPSDHAVSDETIELAKIALDSASSTVFFVNLSETHDSLVRFRRKLDKGMQNKELELGLENQIDLMQSELEKSKVFAIENEMLKYFRDESHGVKPPFSLNALNTRPGSLFTERAEKAFPSAYMDIVEAGRCLALGRNNAAIYHLMQVSEVGLRALAWDRRVTVKQNKKQVVPLDYAQWGEMIRELIKEKDKINQWKRSKPLKVEAIRYYTRAIFEVDSFNEIFRKHIAHARNQLYEMDTAMSCWGHVYRFMDMLAEHMSEHSRTPNVW